ncbi:MAG: hypothetical protein ACI9C0_000315, partial [Alteromonadaceae bacterium]
NVLPKFSIIKLALKGITGGVVDVLDINKYRYFLQNKILKSKASYMSLKSKVTITYKLIS